MTETMQQVETVIYRNVAQWHYICGACLASPEVRERTIEAMGDTVAPAEVMSLWYALKHADGAGVWSEVKQYGIEQRKSGTVIEAMVDNLTTAGLKGKVKQLTSEIAVLTAGSEYEKAAELTKELNDCVEQLL